MITLTNSEHPNLRLEQNPEGFRQNPNGQILIPEPHKIENQRKLILNLSNSQNLHVKDPMKMIVKVGSNTVKVFFTDLVRDLHEESNVTNLGDIEKKTINEESKYFLKDNQKLYALDVFKRISSYAKEFNITDIEFLATESIRKTVNGMDLLTEAKKMFSEAFEDSVPINIKLVSEKEEAEFAKEAVRFERGDNVFFTKTPNLIIDLGGSSGEIIKVQENQIQDISNDPNKKIVSLKLGSHQIINKLEELQDIDKTYDFIEEQFKEKLNIDSIKDPNTNLNLIGGKVRELGEKLLTNTKDGISDFKPDAYELYQAIKELEKELRTKLKDKLGNIREDTKIEEKAKSLSAVLFIKALLENVYGEDELNSKSKDKNILKKEIHFLNAGMVQGYLHQERKEQGIRNPFEGAVLPIRSINPRTLKIGEEIADWVKEKTEKIFEQLTKNNKELISSSNELSRELKNKAIEVAAPLSAIFRVNNNLSSLKAINLQLKSMLSSVKFGFDQELNSRLKTFVRKILLVNFSGKPKELGELAGNEFKNFKEINKLKGDDSAATRIGQVMRLGNLVTPMNPQHLQNIDLNLVPILNCSDRNNSELEISINPVNDNGQELLLGDKVKKAIKRLNQAFLNTVKNLSSTNLIKSLDS